MASGRQSSREVETEAEAETDKTLANIEPEPDKTFANIVSAYTSRFGQNDDQTTVTEEQRTKRQTAAAELADSYYDFASTAYENGWSTHFHYTPFAPHDTIQSALAFYEHRLALLMGLRPGMKVLDVGCGIGGPAREIAKFVGCEVVGVTINQAQVDRAIYLTALEGLSGKCTFVKADFLNLPFAPSSFDAAYAIEATVHSPSLQKVYTNIWRVLKPGAVFGLSEWVMTEKFDPLDPKHIGIRNRLERGNGLCNLHTSEQARAAMIGTGFDVFHDEDYAQHFAWLSAKRGNGDGNGTDIRLYNHNHNHDHTSQNEQHQLQQHHHHIYLDSPVLVPFLADPIPAHPVHQATTTSPSSSQSQSSPATKRTTTNASTSYSSSSLNLRPAPPSSTSTSNSTPSRLIPPHRNWWWPLEGNTAQATTWTDYFTAWKMSKWPRRICYAVLWTLERLGVADRGTCAAMTTLAYCVDSAVEGGREGIFTPCWWFIGRKGGEENREGEEEGGGGGGGGGGELKEGSEQNILYYTSMDR
ncbi:hypothetical protein A1O1_00062 [Capronia coronata CBS 617.96]|uniref:SAM-dependent methyltransferase Erg6/SMT-type domain-containing protein n=1 Tax=Capronia coronata CBS 617.96 TaxID=1182541 RepID=W9ZKB7_9EURO|nr:uncharacterized protein A1O1_00062 [Capronia coronata CBS 617.96]EXJ94944.1 hypothetical protein A1O1_00062 [Capronia coronata CBS 617.96]